MPFAYSLEMFKEQSIRPSRSYANAVTYSSLDSSTRLSSHIRLAQELIDTLYEWLVQISEIQPRPPVLSIFFYNQAMQSDLQKLLLKVLTASTSQQHQRQDHEWSSVTKNRSMDLLCNLYEDSSFLTLSEFTGNANIKLPDLLQLTQGFKNQNLKYDKRLFMIEKAVQKLVVLPVLGPYSFKDIMTKLVDVRIPALINERDRDDDGYNLNSIFERWTSGANEDDIKKILGKWTEQQNLILIGLYGLLRHELSDFQSQMMAPQAPFKMRSHFNFQHHILAQFAFFQQWEAIMVCGKRRATRASLSRFEAMQRQFLFRCRFLGRHVGPFPGAEQGKGTRVTRTPSDSPFSEYIGKFEITSRIDPGALIASTFKNWILSPDCDSVCYVTKIAFAFNVNLPGLKNRLRFDDLCAYLRAYGMGSPSIVSINHYDTNSGTIYIGGTFKNMTEILALTEGEHYLLERREFSPTLAVSMDKLVEMDGNCRLFMELMDDPNKWGLQRPDRRGDVFIESITNGARQYDMTLSQEQAFSKVINNRLQIIWGPPGSGKTHFLALTVLRFIDILRSLASKGKGQGPQTIVLTAFTHSAIDNIVERVAKLHNQIAPHVGFEDIVRPLSLYRLGDPSTLDIEGARVVEPQDLVKLQARSEDNSNKDIIRVVCGTVWQVRRAAHPKTGGDYMRNVQMVIIDEGSQLLAADSIHVIECLDPKYGRLIVAGDHLQLGPVIVGDYPESERVPDPTGSIMKNLMRKTNNTPVSLQWVEDAMVMDIGPCTSQLQENFRMNNQLGSFMKSIYGPNYHVQNPKRTLPYSSSFRGLSYPTEIRCILDPNHSAVCIELQLENDHQCPEIIKVANDSRATAVVEATFVTGIIECYLEMVGPDTATSLFVAVPHHIQRLAILHRVKLPALEAKYPHAMIKIDTIEKMQGQEADLVVVCFVLFDDFTLVNELSYLYSVHRWIVALSRARCKTVLLMTPQLKAPRIMNGSAKANPKDLETLDGWGLLQAFEKYSISLGGKLVWPISKEFLKNIEL
ncbi:P-loop containing nucleoside triphosphate hydrolase protein [Lobosporangium transversale]|uniref:p-loop containing nucleoside triphosphate hydrolase protein n=1 Tax=Lobosporangium transversale TaxID=64571 RepID=A0A1Y2GKF5_9FUNG|nr:P-loop containing nucleoside triphosphate hydrolase protein [Lobosporangium transversale]ORZ10042.1 P-loop containing nucleoside triphosphate hydrolase protein [Lobosporangium transversale]|eukprot:XP_021879132.1 P-loop containing nucleoside triphosphate hydrolase protein [Lobosporangium transversale]